MIRSLIFIPIVLITSNLFAQTECTGPGQLINNGSFNGNLGSGITAPGWMGTQSPDLNDASGILHTTPCYFWIGTPLPSVNGGSWQNLYDMETVAQNCSLVAGQSYQLCFEYAAQGIQCPPFYIFNGPIGITVFINNSPIFSTPDDSTQYTWEFDCISFVAPSSSVNIKFGTTTTNYVALDGVCLVPVTSEGDNPQSSPISIFPNPFNNELHVVGNSNDYSEIQLYDLASKLLYSGSFRNTATINTEPFAPGIYFYIIQNNSGLFKSGKIIKE